MTTATLVPGSGRAGVIFDPRIDKAISWTLMLAASVALALGAWFFSGLQHGMDDLKKEVTELRVLIAKTESDRRDIEELKREMSEIRNVVFQLQKR